MNEIQKYKEYHAIKIRTKHGEKTLLLTDHDMKRCMDRAVKHDLNYEEREADDDGLGNKRLGAIGELGIGKHQHGPGLGIQRMHREPLPE